MSFFVVFVNLSFLLLGFWVGLRTHPIAVKRVLTRVIHPERTVFSDLGETRSLDGCDRNKTPD